MTGLSVEATGKFLVLLVPVLLTVVGLLGLTAIGGSGAPASPAPAKAVPPRTMPVSVPLTDPQPPGRSLPIIQSAKLTPIVASTISTSIGPVASNIVKLPTSDPIPKVARATNASPLLNGISAETMQQIEVFLSENLVRDSQAHEFTTDITSALNEALDLELGERQVGSILRARGYDTIRVGNRRGFEGIRYMGNRVNFPLARMRAAG